MLSQKIKVDLRFQLWTSRWLFLFYFIIHSCWAAVWLQICCWSRQSTTNYSQKRLIFFLFPILGVVWAGLKLTPQNGGSVRALARCLRALSRAGSNFYGPNHRRLESASLIAIAIYIVPTKCASFMFLNTGPSLGMNSRF